MRFMSVITSIHQSNNTTNYILQIHNCQQYLINESHPEVSVAISNTIRCWQNEILKIGASSELDIINSPNTCISVI